MFLFFLLLVTGKINSKLRTSNCFADIFIKNTPVKFLRCATYTLEDNYHFCRGLNMIVPFCWTCQY